MSSWVDRQGDVWTEGEDGLMHSYETCPFPREYVEKKWGPLTVMKGPTLRQQYWSDAPCSKPRVGRWGASWAFECGDVFSKHYECVAEFPTHAEALAAAHRHALEHLGEDTATWAADEFAVGSEVWQEDQQ